MKIFFLIFVLALAFQISNAQTPTQVIATPGSTYVYVGGLTLPYNNAANSQKIIVKILGGSFSGDSNGETVFYISNRDGLKVNQTSIGSATGGRLSLKVYQNGGTTNFYILPITTDYSSFAVTSFTYGNTMTAAYIGITTQSTVPPGTDITSSTPITPVMMTDGIGNVSIGTDNAKGYKLAVNGSAVATSMKVKPNANWPDFVFLKDYKLPTLKEVKTYIDQNQHLPDMPSAEEVRKEGLDLGEINRLLLKKVEELTLYLMEEHDKNAKLENRIQDLEKAKKLKN